MNQKKNVFIEVTHFISDRLLDNPVLFNYVRFLLAGKQIKLRGFIKKYLTQYDCKTIADFCCGTGDFAVCTPVDASYIGWDSNSDFITYSKNKYKMYENIQFKKGNVLKMDEIYQKKYDAVLLISTVHHLSDEELTMLLPKIKRIVKKVVIIADIIPDPPHLLQRFFARIDRGRYVRPKKEKIEILKKYFDVIKTQMIPTQTAVQCGIICIPKK